MDRCRERDSAGMVTGLPQFPSQRLRGGKASVTAGTIQSRVETMNHARTPMRLMSLAVLTVAAVALAAAPADAARKKRSQAVAAQSVQGERGEAGVVVRRSRTRITVTRRSYLDAGTEVYPGSQPYTDYVFSPLYHRPSQMADPTNSQTSLPPPLWIPSYHTPNWGY